MNKYRYLGIDCLPTRLNEKGCFYVVRLKDRFDQILNLSFDNLICAEMLTRLFNNGNNYVTLNFEAKLFEELKKDEL
jgi:hypothetical protein